MSAEWNAQAFHDTHREDLMFLGTAPKKTPRPKAEVVDLMDALKNSLKLRDKQRLRADRKRRASENAPE